MLTFQPDALVIFRAKVCLKTPFPANTMHNNYYWKEVIVNCALMHTCSLTTDYSNTLVASYSKFIFKKSIIRTFVHPGGNSENNSLIHSFCTQQKLYLVVAMGTSWWHWLSRTISKIHMHTYTHTRTHTHTHTHTVTLTKHKITQIINFIIIMMLRII